MTGAAVASAGRLVKPMLRGLHNASIKKNLIVSGVMMTVAGVGLEVFYNGPKRDDYAKFYETYDANASFKRMVEAVLMQSTQEV